jgi:hypothetical protein
MAIPRYRNYPVSGGITGQPCLRGVKIQRPGPPGWGLGVRLTTSPCKKKFFENLIKIVEEAKAHIWAVVPLMMMMMIMIRRGTQQ